MGGGVNVSRSASRRAKILSAAVVGILLAQFFTGLGDASGRTSSRCEGPRVMPGGRPSDITYVQVSVQRLRMVACSTALDIGGRGYSLPGLKPIFGGQFGAGGYGGPFHVGRFRCYLHSRGSDFRVATCSQGAQSFRFSDQRAYWSDVYDPSETVHTVSRSGYCWTGSLTADRDDAWRCFIGNFIYDPCFSSSDAPGVVICPNAWITRGTKIHLTRDLPRRHGNSRLPSVRGLPWNIQLATGQRCLLSSGATSFVDGKRLNYFCTGGLKYGLWGSPDRRTEPWRIVAGPLNAVRLHAEVALDQLWY